MNQTHEPSLSKHDSFLYISIDNWEKNNMDVIGVKTHGLQWWWYYHKKVFAKCVYFHLSKLLAAYYWPSVDGSQTY